METNIFSTTLERLTRENHEYTTRCEKNPYSNNKLEGKRQKSKKAKKTKSIILFTNDDSVVNFIQDHESINKQELCRNERKINTFYNQCKTTSHLMQCVRPFTAYCKR